MTTRTESVKVVKMVKDVFSGEITLVDRTYEISGNECFKNTIVRCNCGGSEFVSTKKGKCLETFTCLNCKKDIVLSKVFECRKCTNKFWFFKEMPEETVVCCGKKLGEFKFGGIYINPNTDTSEEAKSPNFATSIKQEEMPKGGRISWKNIGLTIVQVGVFIGGVVAVTVAQRIICKETANIILDIQDDKE